MNSQHDDSDAPDRWAGKTQTETAELKRQNINRSVRQRYSLPRLYKFAALVVALAMLVACWSQLS